jgi:hypothetical protein
MSDVANSPAQSSAPDISDLSFEQALEQLERIVSELESGQAPLERYLRPGRQPEGALRGQAPGGPPAG